MKFNKHKILCFTILFIFTMLAGCSENANKNAMNENINNEEFAIMDNGIYKLKVGNKMPPFEVSTNKNTTFDLKKCSKPIFVNFWATWCGPCVGEMPDLEEVYEEYKDKVEFIFINCGETKEEVDNFMKDAGKNYKFAVGYDEKNTYPMLFDVTGIPTTYILDKDKTIKQILVGARSKNEYENYIKELLE